MSNIITDMNPTHRTSRRTLLAGAAVAGFGILSASPLSAADTAPKAASAPDDRWHGINAGVASYVMRKLTLDKALAATRRMGLRHISIKDSHLPMNSTTEQRKAAAKLCADAGVTPLSCGVVYMKNDEADIRKAFEYARDLGVPTMVCAPDPASFEILDKMVKEFDIRLAIHNHGPGDKLYPSPYDALKLAEPFDKRVGLCIDIGHTARTGKDPAKAIRDCASRVYDMHMKDLTTVEPKGQCIEVGRGVLDVKSILQAVIDIKFTGHFGFEHEIDADDVVPGIAECVGYCRGVLSTIA